MKALRFAAFFSLLPAFCSGLLPAPAGAAPGFTVSAANVVMPSSGTSESVVTLTSVGGYTGSLALTCAYDGTPPQGKTIPFCSERTPPMLIPIAAGQTVRNSVLLYPPGFAVPATGHGSPARSSSRPLLAGVVLVGGILLLGLRPQRRNGQSLVLIVAGFLVLAGVSACGGGRSGLTPGTYSYTVTAGDQSQTVVSTTFTVTVL
jgi:hypothetical protein